MLMVLAKGLIKDTFQLIRVQSMKLASKILQLYINLDILHRENAIKTH